MDAEEQPLVEHLIDLRKSLLRSLVFFVLCFAASLLFINKLVPIITQHHELVMMGPLDVIRLYTGIAASVSLGLSLPFIAHQLWLFVRPALTEKERNAAVKFLPAISLSFIGGLLFGYFVIFPTIYHFLIEMGQEHFKMFISAKEYFSFLLMFTIPFGFLFEVPLVLLFLTTIGVITPSSLGTIRKYAYIVLAIVSAVITPPDFFSQLIVLAPLIVLYEIGVFLSKMKLKKAMKLGDWNQGDVSHASKA